MEASLHAGTVLVQVCLVSMSTVETTIYPFHASKHAAQQYQKTPGDVNIKLTLFRHSFIAKCCARITWLGQQIHSLDPEFDLRKGPPVNMNFIESFGSQESPEMVEGDSSSMNFNNASSAAIDYVTVNSAEESTTNKRSHAAMDESEETQPLSVEARSVAIDLGMLSLHSDSRQKHYLGSSSGLLFTKLIGLDGETEESSSASVSSSPFNSRRWASPRPERERNQLLYGTLAKVGAICSFD